MNAAAALVSAGRADSLADAMPMAIQSIDTGAAEQSWERWWSSPSVSLVASLQTA